MRATVSIYEHPELTESEVWGSKTLAKGGSGRTTVYLYPAVGLISLIGVSSLAAYTLASLSSGSSMLYRFVPEFDFPCFRFLASRPFGLQCV